MLHEEATTGNTVAAQRHFRLRPMLVWYVHVHEELFTCPYIYLSIYLAYCIKNINKKLNTYKKYK